MANSSKPTGGFQSTLPARGATIPSCCWSATSSISIHAPREGSDFPSRFIRSNRVTFQSTLPARGATAPCPVTDPVVTVISIHAPREGSDHHHADKIAKLSRDFNPRSPRGERPARFRIGRRSDPFQSTLPARGATTLSSVFIKKIVEFQSTLPARGATYDKIKLSYENKISIHAPREGSDPASAPHPGRCNDFNPRSPRGERQGPLGHHRQHQISIHAPREGSDPEQRRPPPRPSPFQSTLPARGATEEGLKVVMACLNFNPRSPRGERLVKPGGGEAETEFQSTLPARGATPRVRPL